MVLEGSASQSLLPASFKPAWWCRGAHAQTIAGAWLRPRPRLKLNRRRFETPDGDFLDVDFCGNSSLNGKSKSPLILILHGLEGSSKAPYVQSLLATLEKCEAEAAAINMRMCNGEANRLKQTYHSGKTEDLDFVIRQISKEFPAREIYLVGYSIGGNIVLKWLGENGRQAQGKVRKAVAVSVPYDLAQSVELIDQGFNREVYTRLLLGRLKKKLAVKQKTFPDAVAYGRLKGVRTFRVFDNLVTAPLNGFRDAGDYWTKSSSKSFLRHVKVPTLLIHAEDDPFFPGLFLPHEEIEKSGFIETLFVPCGGHVGFVSGPWPWRQDPWLERSILDFLFS